ncbi:MAG: DUF177 domain-containing protein [Burkholderiales bacterium]|nr:DUF177 domain-containing protein [Burkholderiales bacterium]
MNAFVIDAFGFARQQDSREGKIAIADMARMLEDCADDSGEISWQLQGTVHALDVPQLNLHVKGTVQLMCQRCLQPFAFEVDSHSSLMLAKNDEHADEIDALLDDESLDVIVASHAFNIFELIEDEALLALPLSPRHETCPDSSVMDLANDTKELPFAALTRLKQ